MREALEADETGEARYAHRLPTKIDRVGTHGHCLVIEWRQSSPHDVDDPVPTVDTQTLLASDIFGGEYLFVAQPPAVNALEKAEYGGISVRAVRYEQITVLGGANMAMSDHGKATDYDVL
jgi:hypothetical protein